MEARVQLALIEKARRVFSAEDDVFLSFPLLRNISYDVERFTGLLAPISSEDYAAAADFARMVNFIPKDIVANPDDDLYLWDVYADILARGMPGSNPAGTADAARLAAARALLYTPGGGESEAYKTYRQMRDAFIAASEDYATQRLTGELSTEPAIKQDWTEREPILKARIDAARADWETIGRRADIEAAVAFERTEAANDPESRWAEWLSEFDPALDLMTDTGGRYGPTGYAPADLGNNAAWSTFDLTRGEIDALVHDAPEPLRNALRNDDAGAVESIQFDYRSVAINRPWFKAAALASRIWKLPDGESLLSDGANPATGRCPAYVSAIVLMRNLEVRRTTAPEATPARPPNFAFTLKPDLLTTRRTIDPFVLDQIRLIAPPTKQPVQPPVSFRKLDAMTFSPHLLQTGVLTPQGAATEQARTALNPQIARRLNIDLVTASRLGRQSAVKPMVTHPVEAAGAVRLTPRSFPPRWGQPQADPAPAPPPQPEPSPTVTILAFICKRLPRAPDPLPELTWA